MQSEIKISQRLNLVLISFSNVILKTVLKIAGIESSSMHIFLLKYSLFKVGKERGTETESGRERVRERGFMSKQIYKYRINS